MVTTADIPWPFLPPSRPSDFSFTLATRCLLSAMHVLSCIMYSALCLSIYTKIMIYLSSPTAMPIALLLSPNRQQNINNASTMRDVTAGIEKYDEWYLINDTIANNKYNNTTLQLWALEEQVHVHVGVWNYTPQDDGTWQIFAKGFFLGLDEENTTQPILHPLADFGKSGFGFWSMIALPTVFVTRTVWVTSSRFVAAKTSFLGGRVTSILTLSVTETQVWIDFF